MHSSFPGLSEKELGDITKYGDEAARKAADAGDAEACKKWLDEYFKKRAA